MFICLGMVEKNLIQENLLEKLGRHFVILDCTENIQICEHERCGTGRSAVLHVEDKLSVALPNVYYCWCIDGWVYGCGPAPKYFD